jgi:hypothetical protein
MHSLLSSTEFFNFDSSPKSKYLPSSNPVDASRTPAESIDTLTVASITEERCFEILRLCKKKTGGETADSEAAKL